MTWTSLSLDLSSLDIVELPRYTLSEDDPADLYIYCDISKASYGFTAYIHQGGESKALDRSEGAVYFVLSAIH